MKIKNKYTFIVSALFTMLVIFGIAYATYTPAKASHDILYSDKIEPKNGDTIVLNGKLELNPASPSEATVLTAKGSIAFTNPTSNIFIGGTDYGSTIFRVDGSRYAHILPWGGPNWKYDILCIGCGSGGVVLSVPGGTINAATKNFEIDHPTKKEMRLVHSTLEGPYVGVYYKGEGKLSSGKSTILLPDYFEALTREEGRNVQLTAKGTTPYLLSASEVSDGKFEVYGTKKDGEFYWEVKAVRADVPELVIEKPK